MQVRGAEEKDRDYDIDGHDVILHTTTYTEAPNTDPFAVDAKEIVGLTESVNKSLGQKARREREKLQKRYEGKDGTGSKKIEDHIITGYNAFDVVAPPHNLDHLAKLYGESTAHKAAVDAKVSNIVGLGYELIPSPQTKMKMDGMTGKKAENFQRRLTKGKQELIDEIDDKNEEDTFTEILKKVWTDYETTGNGYLEISRSKTTGEIGYIGHVPCVSMRVRRDRDGFVQIIANKAVFFRNFGKDDPDPIGGDANPSEIIHFKKYSPSSTFYGVPDIIPAAIAIAGNKFSAQYNLDFFENKATPRHVIILKGATINPRLAKNILEFFETGLKGKNHRSLFIPLPGDNSERKVELKIEPVEAGVQEASFKSYRKENLSEILMAHRVPINKIGLPEGVSLAVARDADKTFKEQVCNPEQRIAEKKINKVILDIQGQSIFIFKLNELTLTDEDTQSKIDERRIKTGTELPNEQRARRGEPAIPGGDERVDLNAKANTLASENRASGNRQRDADRSAGATDSAGEGRNAKGEGRTNSAG